MKTHKNGWDILYLTVRAAAYLSAAYLCALALLIMGACIGWGFAFADKSADVRRGTPIGPDTAKAASGFVLLAGKFGKSKPDACAGGAFV